MSCFAWFVQMLSNRAKPVILSYDILVKKGTIDLKKIIRTGLKKP